MDANQLRASIARLREKRLITKITESKRKQRSLSRSQAIVDPTEFLKKSGMLK